MAFDGLKRKARMCCATDRTEQRETIGRLRSSSANADLFRVQPSAAPQNLSIPKCHIFFPLQKRSDVAEDEKKIQIRQKRQSHV